ncbi:hypothetical protein C1646_820615 [Rhizophagus diaphanus]|nr:hypothetical protein C1646_820615 [Rhizophagus diaphanus] [Rhizophagus sp. MUCL 43196]
MDVDEETIPLESIKPNASKELEKRLAHCRKINEEHEAIKKLYDEVKRSAPKEVAKMLSERNRTGLGSFFHIHDDENHEI